MSQDIGPIARSIIAAAEEVAASFPDFDRPKGPGAGDRTTADFLKRLREKLVSKEIQVESERKVGEGIAYSFDFYVPTERTVVEIALGARNSSTEYEKDVLKCLIARSKGTRVDRLILIGKPGARKRLSEPGPRAIAEHALLQWNLEVVVLDIGLPHERVQD